MFSEVTCVTADRTASTYCASIARAGWGGGLAGRRTSFSKESWAELGGKVAELTKHAASGYCPLSSLILHTITLRNNRQCKYFYRLLSSYLALCAFRVSRGYGSEFLLSYCLNINIEYEIRPEPEVFIFQKFTWILNISCFQRKYYSDICPKYS